MEKKDNKPVTLQDKVTQTMLLAFKIIIIASLLVPAIAAYFVRWELIFIYPVLLVLLLSFGLFSKKK